MYPFGNDHYYHEMIALAEGFEELNHIVIGNCNYWWQPEKNSFLINEAIEDNSFDIAIYDYRYVTSFDHLLFRKGYPNFDQSKKHILVDRNDWLQPIWWKNKHYDIFDFIFSRCFLTCSNCCFNPSIYIIYLHFIFVIIHYFFPIKIFISEI